MTANIAMSAGIFTNCSRGQAAQSLILSAIYSPCCLLPSGAVACAQRYISLTFIQTIPTDMI